MKSGTRSSLSVRVRNKSQSPEVIELPHAAGAEDGVLSSFLQSPALLRHFRSAYTKEHFYNVCNRQLWSEMDKMDRDGKTLDPVTVGQWLIDRGIIDEIGGPSRVAELLNFVTTPENYRYYCGILDDKLKLRDVWNRTDTIRTAVKDEGADMNQFNQIVVGECSQIQSILQEKDEEQTFEDQVQETITEWEEVYSGNRASAYTSPWPAWDRYLGGIKKGYVLIMAPRKSGKSSLAKDLVLHMAMVHKQRAMYFSYEMSYQDTIRRMLCDLSGVSSQYIFQPDVFKPSEEQAKSIAKAASRLHSAPLKVVNNPNLNVDGISFIIRKFRPKLAVVDYLQLLPPPPGIDGKDNYERQVAENSRRLQILSCEINESIIVLSQMNANGEARWSASTENDIDLALAIQPEGVLVKSQRNGPSGGQIPIALNGETFKFEEIQSVFPE